MTGQMVAPAWGSTRPEADLLAPGQAVVASDTSATRWPCGVDNLSRPRSASLVRSGVPASELALARGEQGQRGILAPRQARAAVLRDPRPRLVFHDTPQQTSWVHQLDIW
jgi:hypothetical protein